MPLTDFIKEIEAKKLKAVQDRLKKEKPNQKVVPDPKQPAIYSTLLHLAVQVRELGVVDALLAGGADTTALDHEDCTPLHWAARTDGKEAQHIAEALIKKKAKVDALNKLKHTPLHTAAASGSVAVLEALLKAGAAADNAAPGSQPIHCAAQSNVKASVKLSIIDRLVEAGAKLDAKDSEGRTALLLLVSGGKVAEAQQLMERPHCGLDATDAQGLPLLLREVSAELPNMDLVRSLVEKGASGDAQEPSGNKDTVLHVAARRGGPLSLDLVKALLPACKKPHTRNAKKETPAAVALEAGGTEGQAVALAILSAEAGSDLGDTGPALMKAAMDNKADDVAAKLVEVMKPAAATALGLDFGMLVSAGLGKAAMAYVKRFDEGHSGDQAIDAQGNSHLHMVAESGAQYEVVVAMVGLGLDPSRQNKEGDTPLHVAARAGHVEVCKALCEGGVDVLRRNAKNRTARGQLKLPDCTKDYLADAEEAFKKAKEDKKAALWDDKMKATQTESAFGVRAL